MKTYSILLIGCVLLFTIAISSCSERHLPADQLIEWVEKDDNGQISSKQAKNVVVEIQRKPVEYIIAKENRGNTLTKEAYEARRKELEGLEYYDLKISVANKNGSIMKHALSYPQEYFERLDYFSYKMKNDLQLQLGEKTSPCVLYHFERSFDIAPHRTFVLAFEKPKDYSGDRVLVFNEHIFGLGRLKFRFSEGDINNIPKVKVI